MLESTRPEATRPKTRHPFRRQTPSTIAEAPAFETRRVYRKPTLSAREIEVMLAWFASDSKTVAAQSIHISVGTINTHISRIRQKYSAVGRAAPTKAALFARALQDGLTRLDDW